MLLRRLFIAIGIICYLLSQNVQAVKPALKAGIEYSIYPNQVVALRITKIPRKYPWVERDIDGNVVNPKRKSTILMEMVENQKLKTSRGDFYLPSGTKFWGKIEKDKKERSFGRDEQIGIRFYRIQLPGQISKEIDLGYSNDVKRKKLSNKLSKVGKTVAYTAAGALAGPLITYRVLSFPLGSAVMSNPYVLGGSSAVGAVAGLVLGMKSRGKKFKIEPGKEVEVNLKEEWILKELPRYESFSNKKIANKKSKQEEYINKVDLKIVKTKKSKDYLRQDLIKIQMEMDGEDYNIGFNSFKLVDSMGKEFLPEVDSLPGLSGLNEVREFDLAFAVEFPKTVHYLNIYDLNNYHLIAQEKIVIK